MCSMLRAVGSMRSHCGTPDASTIFCAAAGQAAPAWRTNRVLASMVQFSAAQPFRTGAVSRHHKLLTAMSYAGALQQPCR